MEEHGLAPAPEADRRTLIRRLTFDLTGLPPTPGEIDAFLADRSPDAYERLVDRLLASPHYGERWGRHWLDLVRFAETAGHEFDYDIPNAFRYRDYVIRAFNADLPYDQFVDRAGRRRPARRAPAASRRRVQRVGHRAPASSSSARGRIRRSTSARRRCAGSTTRSTSSPRPSWPDRRLRPLPRPQVRPDHRRRTTTPWPATSRARGISRRSSIPPTGSTSRRASRLQGRSRRRSRSILREAGCHAPRVRGGGRLENGTSCAAAWRSDAPRERRSLDVDLRDLRSRLVTTAGRHRRRLRRPAHGGRRLPPRPSSIRPPG